MKKVNLLSKLFVSATMMLAIFAQTIPAHADFNHNLIMTDNIFNNSGSMNTSQINAFLNSFPSSCLSTNNGFSSPDPTGYNPSDGYTYGANVSGGQVIADAAQAYGINPQVLLATLQKESSVVSGTASYHCQYINTAMGYGCPDSGSCPTNPATMSGFSKQVIHAAWLLKFGEERSKGNTGWNVQYTNYPQPGDHWDNSDDPPTCYGGPMTQGTLSRGCSQPAVYYDGYTSIDGSTVHIDSGATAALYWYTPHFSGNQNFITIFQGWFGNTVSQTPLMYSPAVVSPAAGQINVFARGQDYRLWQNWYSNSAWQANWNYIDGQSPTAGSPVAITWGNGHMDVFETMNGQVWHNWYLPDSTGWRGWQPIGAPNGIWLGGSMAAVAQTSGKINLFVRGNDHRLWQTWYDNGGWHSWNYVDGPSSYSSSPSAISWGSGHMDVFETRYGQLWHAWYGADSTGWRGEQPIGAPNGVFLVGAPATVVQASGKINVFARGTDGRLWQTWYSDGTWHSWNYVDGPSSNSSAPSAFSWSDGQMDIYEVRGGVLWHTWYNADSTGWRPFSSIGTP
jgi:hypothetical protein